MTNEIGALGLVTMDMHDIIYTSSITYNPHAVVQAYLSVLSVYKHKEMASQDEGSQKWKRKRMLEAKAEKMRATKKVRQQETHEERGGDGSGCDNEAGPWWEMRLSLKMMAHIRVRVRMIEGVLRV